jgi:hypothetical protein
MLDSIKEEVSKLVHIHLDLYVCLLSIEIFEGSEEIWVEISISTVMQVEESFFELIDNVLL